jgi:adenosylcobinamide-GDP ribazoletransferase
MNGRIVSAFAQIRLAAGFLTIIPVVAERPSAGEEVGASLGWFPAVGFAIGAGLACADYLLGFVCRPPLRAGIVVMALAIVTGAIHLDGLADTADALGAGHDRARALAIMRDSRIGSFGALALFLVLALKILAIAGATGSERRAALYFAPGLARWTMVALAHRLHYLRDQGTGAALLARDGGRNFNLASLIAVVAAIPAVGSHALRAYAAAVAVTILLGAFYRRWIGGVTGDMIGAGGEIVETAVLIALAN